MSRDREHRVKARLRLFVAELKSKPCVDCGVRYEHFCMEFDHIGPKTYAISQMVDMKASRERILAEIAHTEVVCILCHRMRTFERRLTKKTAASKTPNLSAILVQRHKVQSCMVCHQRRPWYQMDLDHRDPASKRFSLASAKDYSPSEVRAELAKCDLLCALCHRRKTYQGTYEALLASPKGLFRPNIRVTPSVIHQVLDLKNKGTLQKDIAIQLGVGQATVSQIVRGTYKNSCVGA